MRSAVWRAFVVLTIACASNGTGENGGEGGAGGTQASDAGLRRDSAMGASGEAFEWDGGVDQIVDGNDGSMPPASFREVTFFAFGDPQYGGGPSDKNSFHIQALNQASLLSWPIGYSRAGMPVGNPRGVIIAGDLTQNGQSGRNPLNEWYTADPYAFDLNREYGVNVAKPRVSAELGLFLRDYGLRGNDGQNAFVLKWPVFEGYGNHDFDVLEQYAAIYGGEAPARDIVSVRNQVRAKWPEIRRMGENNAGHYSWDWDDVHLVHLNLAGADMRTSTLQLVRDPQRALTFLEQDLAAEIGASCRPVVVTMHYGFDDFSAMDRWWDTDQRIAFLHALAPYNVVAILHGHVHETRVYAVQDEVGRSYDVFSLGSPFYDGQSTNGGRGHFAVFRLSEALIEAADISWLPANPVLGLEDGRDLWTGKRLAALGFQTTTTFPDGWGGWTFTKPIDRHRCP